MSKAEMEGLKLSKKKSSKRRQKDDAAHRLTRLLRIESNQLNEQLLVASEKGKQRAVFLLLHQGIDKDRCKGLLGYSPVHHAAARGHLEVLKLLIDFGWSVDVRNDALETPLHLACFDGHTQVAELLLDRGASINAKTKDQETPLFYAARKGQYRTVRLLVRRECDLAVKNCYGDLAEEEARDAKTLAEFVAGNEDLQRQHGKDLDGGERALSQVLRERILSFLDLRSLGYASQVSYRWHRASDSPSLWKKFGVSRWGLLLNSTMGMGTIPQLTMLQTATNDLLRLNLSMTASRRPSSCDPVILGRVMPLSAKEKERPRCPEQLRPRTANIAGI
ncbi:Ankyrin-1 [Phytophthora citrophthora]|uniref:Ankyrin-1 n=1 Tax=Phytophthora citrophthora TaxID=4793 RepID=A0AAD9GSD3_9STRA|nr:Ankyrin-1 [Phytophthora citrophthora]